MNFIFSHQAVSSMMRFTLKAISNVETITTEVDFQNSHQGPNKKTYRSVPNPYLTCIEMYFLLDSRGCNTAITKLPVYKMFEDERKMDSNTFKKL